MDSTWLELAVPFAAWGPADLLASPSWLLSLCVVFILARFLNLFSTPEPPKVHLNPKASQMQQLIDNLDILKAPYKPPSLWGRSGHIQTAAYGLLGHATLKRQCDRRDAAVLSDGTTVTFDVFEPFGKHPQGDFTLVLVPGIANSAESNYIRTCVHFVCEKGYRCVVLNHLGALQDVPLTSNRIFSYGGTEELEGLMEKLMVDYPETRFINVGFSMGANITTLYLNNVPEEKRSRFVIGLSVCQGYSVMASAPLTHDWEGGRRAYNYVITENMKRLLRRNYDAAVAPHVRSGLVDEQRLWSCTSIISLDEQYSRRILGYPSIETFYEASASINVVPHLRIPMVFVNALDDPIVPPPLWKTLQGIVSEKDNLVHVLTKHGGHLGFLEGSSFAPQSVTWLDRFICELAESAVKLF